MLFDARQQTRNLGIRNPVIDRPSVPAAGQDLAGLKQSQMFAGLIGAYAAQRGDFMYGIFSLQQGVEHPQSRRMRYCLQTLGRGFRRIY
jgi:hypothetical protein